MGGGNRSGREENFQSGEFASSQTTTRIDAITGEYFDHFGVEEMDAIRLRFGETERDILQEVSLEEEKDFFFALCCLGKIPGGTPFSQLHKGDKQSCVDRP